MNLRYWSSGDDGFILVLWFRESSADWFGKAKKLYKHHDLMDCCFIRNSYAASFFEYFLLPNFDQSPEISRLIFTCSRCMFVCFIVGIYFLFNLPRSIFCLSFGLQFEKISREVQISADKVWLALILKKEYSGLLLPSYHQRTWLGTLWTNFNQFQN